MCTPFNTLIMKVAVEMTSRVYGSYKPPISDVKNFFSHF